jgi:peptidoglycan hydrolase-like protein with peptidoglycan-binding domain
MKAKMKKILVPGIILGFVLMLMNVPAAFAQQQAATAEKAAVRQQAAAAEKSAVNKMETQMPAMPTSKSEVNKSVAQSQKKAATMMESTNKKAVMSNHEIKLVQEALNKDGYKLKVDGILGMHTSNAIKSFQKKNDLKVTGQPDPMTLAKLNLK